MMKPRKTELILSLMLVGFICVCLFAVKEIIKLDYQGAVEMTAPSSSRQTTEHTTATGSDKLPTVTIVLPETEESTEADTTTEETTTTIATTPEATTEPKPTTTKPQPTTTKPQPTTTTPPPTTAKPQTPTESPTTISEGSNLVLTTVEPSYFDDALFIGDSRTVGIQLYGILPGADYFCNTGMSIYSLHKASVKVGDLGSVSLTELLAKKSYGKVYIMLGVNELGYSFSKTVKKFGELIDEVLSYQPTATIYIQANLHVTKKRSEKDSVVNNKAINRYNAAISGYANNENIFYIDANEFFDDEEGNLSTAYSSDSTHIRSKYYAEWSRWLCTKVFVQGP